MSQTNARKELLRHAGKRRVAYGKIVLYPYYERRALVTFDSHDAFLAALPALDFTYDAGYGGQELFGFVVFEDGTWLERGEYDGSEWWEHKQTPTRAEVAEFDPSADPFARATPGDEQG
jgi:hypothetical protein